MPLAAALLRGGLKVLEVTLRSEHGLAAIAAIRKQLPEAIVGAGTVLSPGDYISAVKAGAEFIVSPGCSDALLAEANNHAVHFLPGVATPSEAMKLMAQGFYCLKFFPAQASGGAAWLQSIAGPLPQLKFCPTGGVSPDNASDYFGLDNVLCVGGSWMLDSQLIQDNNWQAIEVAAKNAAQLKS